MIKMLTAISGSKGDVKCNDTTDMFSKEEEKRLIEAGLAEAVKSTKKK